MVGGPLVLVELYLDYKVLGVSRLVSCGPFDFAIVSIHVLFKRADGSHRPPAVTRWLGPAQRMSWFPSGYFRAESSAPWSSRVS